MPPPHPAPNKIEKLKANLVFLLILAPSFWIGAPSRKSTTLACIRCQLQIFVVTQNERGQGYAVCVPSKLPAKMRSGVYSSALPNVVVPLNSVVV